MILKTFLVLVFQLKVAQTNPWDGPHVYLHRLPFNWAPIKQTIEVVADLENQIFTGNTTITARAEADLLQEFRLHAYLTGDPKIVFIENLSCKNGVAKIDNSNVETFSFEERQEFGFRVTKPEKFRFRRGDILTVKLGFQSRLYEKKFGIYRPDPLTNSFVTNFQPPYARSFIPCFDEPKYRAYFTLNARVKEDTNEYFIMNNMPGYQDVDSGWYHFNQTKISLPAYLVAFAILGKNEYILVHSFLYSGKPIKFWTSKKLQDASWTFFSKSYEKLNNLDPDEDIEGKEDTATVQFVMSEALSWCESHFGVDLIWDKMDFLFADNNPGGMEHPGFVLITINQTDFANILKMITHEIIHHWSGLIITTDSYDSMWINEGVTTYANARFRFELHERHRDIPYGFFPNLGLLYYSTSRIPISVIDREVLATENPTYRLWPFMTSTVYYMSANLLANLDEFMGSTLLQCLGQLMKRENVLTKGASFSERELLDELNKCILYKGTATNYPVSSTMHRAVPEFAYPWLHKSDLFYLELAYEYDAEKGQYVLLTNYSIICVNEAQADCETTEISVNPIMFVVTIYDFYENILHSTFIHHADQFQVQRQPMEFDPYDYPLFVVNMRYSGNFMVKYPDSVYDAFISKLIALEKAGINDTAEKLFSIDKRFELFGVNLLELSKRNKVRMTYLFKLISLRHAWGRIMRPEELIFYNYFNWQLNVTRNCLKGAFLTYVQENDPNMDNYEIVRKFSCRVDNSEGDCQYDKVNLTTPGPWEQMCLVWARKWNGKMQVYLKEFNQQEGYDD